MTLKVVTMAERRLAVLVESKRTGESITELRRRYKISSQTYHPDWQRYLAESLDGG